MRRLLALTLTSVLAAAAPAAAQDDPALSWPPRYGGLLPVQGEEKDGKGKNRQSPHGEGAFIIPDEGKTLELPRFRAEVWARSALLLATKIKKGPERDVHTFFLHRDAHLPPLRIMGGYRFIFDVKFHEKFVAGVHYSRLLMEGPRRHIHHTGIHLQSRYFQPFEPVRTLVDIQFGEVFLRFVIRDNKRLRVAIGTGASWTSFRVRLSSRSLRSDGRVEDFLYPTLSYTIAVGLTSWLTMFFETVGGVISPKRYPSYVSEARLGFRVPLGYEVELNIAGTFSAAMIATANELWGGKLRQGHRWTRAEWLAMGLDLGLAVRF